MKHQCRTAATHITKCQTEDFNTLASTWNKEASIIVFQMSSRIFCFDNQKVTCCSMCQLVFWNMPEQFGVRVGSFEGRQTLEYVRWTWRVRTLSILKNDQPRPRYRPVDAEDGRIDTSSYGYALWRILEWSKAPWGRLSWDIMIDIWQPSPTFHS